MHDVLPWKSVLSLLSPLAHQKTALGGTGGEHPMCGGVLNLPFFLASLQDTAPPWMEGRPQPSSQRSHSMRWQGTEGRTWEPSSTLAPLLDSEHLAESQAGTAHIHKRGSIRSHKSQRSSVTGVSISAGRAVQSHIQGVGSAQGAGNREQEEQNTMRPESRLDRYLRS